jgi:hypothetical protein
MQMLPPSGGDTFTANDGFSYSSTTGVAIEVGQGGVHVAFLRGWTEVAPTNSAAATVLTPLTGFSYTVPNAVQALVLTPAGTIAAGTITTPSTPSENQALRVTTSQTVTSLTLTANTGQTVVGAPTTITAATPFELFYNSATASWYRR